LSGSEATVTICQKKNRHSETAFGGRGYLFPVRSSWDDGGGQ